MSDSDLVPWTELAESRLRTALRSAALALTLCAVVAVAVGAVLAPGWGRWLVVVAAAVALVLAAARVGRQRRCGELCVRQSGSLLWRPDRAAEPVEMAAVFCSPWLIVLAAGPATVDIWPDQLDGPAFRRLSACARWRPARAGAARGLS